MTTSRDSRTGPRTATCSTSLSDWVSSRPSITRRFAKRWSSILVAYTPIAHRGRSFISSAAARAQLPEGGVVAEGPHGSDAVALGYVFATQAADGAFAAMSDRLAPKGYAYLLVVRGQGTVASCMFDEFHNKQVYLERTVAFFREKVGFDMQNARRFGGAGGFDVPPTGRCGDLLFVGEAAGFQDALWGFGMRYAMLSGSLAARSLVSGRLDGYDRLWEERLGGLLRTGIVNRFLYGRLGARGYRGLAWLLDRTADPRSLLGRLYRPSLLARLLYPIARQAIRSGRRTRLRRREPTGTG